MARSPFVRTLIADEACHSQYHFVDGFASQMRDALPNASFIAFAGMPIELTDRDTLADRAIRALTFRPYRFWPALSILGRILANFR